MTIENQFQYELTLKQIERFNDSIKRYSIDAAIKKGTHKLIAKAILDGMLSQKEELEQQVKDYETKTQ